MWNPGFCVLSAAGPADEISLKIPACPAREFNAPVDKSYLLQLRFVVHPRKSVSGRLVGDRYIAITATVDIGL